MTELLPASPLSISLPESHRFAFPNNNQCLTPNSHVPFSQEFSKTTGTLVVVASSMGPRVHGRGSRGGGYSFYNNKQLGFDEREVKNLGLEGDPTGDGSVGEKDIADSNDPFDGVGLREMDDPVGLGANGEGEEEEGGGGFEDDDDLVKVQVPGGAANDDLRKDDVKVEKFSGKDGIRRGKEVIRRSNLLAKQVISIRSALSLGFVTQLWVDTTSWMVLFVEVRPNLLSGDADKFFLEDISQVGDVVLVPDERVIENGFKMVGLETLVGYKVVTPSQRNIGKVRGYTFSLNSGAVEELELDSFGLSIIPSTLVSTYSLLVEDVLEVVSDAVVVREAAASRIQRLSKGFLGNQNVGVSMDDLEDYDSEPSVTYGQVSRRRKSLGRKKPNQRYWDNEDDWDLPMDYL
ncbi:uncharacterized protein LOC130954812 [Arachis stenosperma]|uniref:uncharacterized protein LOC130954812 n=1 Tax=Arachis stenosperma TaxID=217475 RepID=UPI0025ACB336|nr:uncharacterized protein LOC130954812 [Arachis stenosperma]